MTWLHPIFGSLQAQREAAFRLLLLARETGRLTTHQWEPSNLDSRAKPIKYGKKKKPTREQASFQYSKTNDGNDKALLARKMKREGKLTTSQMADQLNVHPATVRKWLRQTK